jgi:hypothetical protein
MRATKVHGSSSAESAGKTPGTSIIIGKGSLVGIMNTYCSALSAERLEVKRSICRKGYNSVTRPSKLLSTAFIRSESSRLEMC